MDKNHKKHLLNQMLNSSKFIKINLEDYIKENNLNKTKLPKLIDDVIKQLQRMIKEL